MAEIFIRNIRKEDIPFVVDIQINSWKTAYKGIIDDKFLSNMNKNDIIERRKKDYKDNGFIVALEGDTIVGFSRYIYDNKYTPDIPNIDCELMAIYVRTDKKHMGIGRKMFQYVISEFKKSKKENMILWCLKENYDSRKFYESMGGKIVREHNISFGEKEYPEVGFQYNLKKDK